MFVIAWNTGDESYHPVGNPTILYYKKSPIEGDTWVRLQLLATVFETREGAIGQLERLKSELVGPGQCDFYLVPA